MLGFLLATCIVLGSAQWCNVDPLSRVDCLFKSETPCVSFGCCWNATVGLCYDPANSCHGPAITNRTLSRLFGFAPKAQISGGAFAAQARQCSDDTFSNCTEWADDQVELLYAGQNASCISYNCPALGAFIFRSAGGVNVNLASGPTGVCNQYGQLNLTSGLVAPFSLCGVSVVGSEAPALTVEVGYLTDSCAHFAGATQNVTLADGYKQVSFSLRVDFA